jgi:hypothetical protein
MPKSSRSARDAPPTLHHLRSLPSGCKYALLLAAVVVTVSVAVTLLFPVIVTGLVDPKLNVGGF